MHVVFLTHLFKLVLTGSKVKIEELHRDCYERVPRTQGLVDITIATAKGCLTQSHLSRQNHRPEENRPKLKRPL